MNFTKNPEIPLRVGLAFTYLYSGLGLMRNPIDWSGFAPVWLLNLIERFVSIDMFFRVQGIGEFVLGLLLLAWFLPARILHIIVVIGTIQISSILLFVGVDFVTFRDVGLLGAWLSLLIIVHNKIRPIATELP